MVSSKKIGIIVLFVLGIGVFGYSQYAAASQIEVSIAESNLVNEDENGSNHEIRLQFDNPSVLLLNAGETEFFVFANNESIGKGQLESFTLQPLSSSYVDGKIYTSSQTEDESESVKLTGITKYNLLFTSLDIPFVYYPTSEQASEFIHHR